MEEPIYLFTITDRIRIEGRGVVIVPGIPWAKGTPSVRRGAPLILRTPLGEIIHTTVQEMEMITYRPDAKRLVSTPILLSNDVQKFDIPIGTEVFLASGSLGQNGSEQQGVDNRPLPR